DEDGESKDAKEGKEKKSKKDKKDKKEKKEERKRDKKLKKEAKKKRKHADSPHRANREETPPLPPPCKPEDRWGNDGFAELQQQPERPRGGGRGRGGGGGGGGGGEGAVKEQELRARLLQVGGMKKGETAEPLPKKAKGPRAETHKLSFGMEDVGGEGGTGNLYSSDGVKSLHHNFVVALLNDLFGIQSRGGCSCAGPYGMDLYHIDAARIEATSTAVLGSGGSAFKQGWFRVNFNYFISDQQANFIIAAIEWRVNLKIVGQLG
ncbi:hypothetical protein T484DRAFT_1786612, partial [Baffinella frigidus]